MELDLQFLKALFLKFPLEGPLKGNEELSVLQKVLPEKDTHVIQELVKVHQAQTLSHVLRFRVDLFYWIHPSWSSHIIAKLPESLQPFAQTILTSFSRTQVQEEVKDRASNSKIYVLSEEIKAKLEGCYDTSKTTVEVVTLEQMNNL